MNATSYKTVTESAIIKIAEKLMYEFKSITTLEVKSALRKEGYFAKQDEISKLMDSAYLKQNWNFAVKTTNDGRQYRVYELSDPTKLPDSLTDASTVINAATGMNVNTGVKIYTRRDGRTVQTISTGATGDWEVTYMNGNVEYFPGNFTRDEVRTAYANLNQVKKETTRAHRLK